MKKGNIIAFVAIALLGYLGYRFYSFETDPLLNAKRAYATGNSCIKAADSLAKISPNISEDLMIGSYLDVANKSFEECMSYAAKIEDPKERDLYISCSTSGKYAAQKLKNYIQLARK